MLFNRNASILDVGLVPGPATPGTGLDVGVVPGPTTPGTGEIAACGRDGAAG
jgi:hypothetical protein